nr:hypothetical protein [Suid alphaherpesvirus 1]WEY31998.1 hypothetical protein [Suid alphaherpesvirus 1]WEY32075.1 hypothetical protein [Suid alphaherpesvirus 1]WEY32153.1 hypothetical protein [Suid alphaherpesvirus 1]WEY32225.1 hypothetical protein [Suid alphaherpesvirus 1]
MFSLKSTAIPSVKLRPCEYSGQACSGSRRTTVEPDGGGQT